MRLKIVFTMELQVQYMHYLYTCTWVKRDTHENFKFREPLYLFRRSQPDYYGFKKYCDFFTITFEVLESTNYKDFFGCSLGFVLLYFAVSIAI